MRTGWDKYGFGHTFFFSDNLYNMCVYVYSTSEKTVSTMAYCTVQYSTYLI